MANPARSFFPVESTREPKPPSRKPQAPSTPESKFWRSFRNTQLSSGLIHSITSLAFSPAPPHDLAASVSTSVILYDGLSLSPKPFSPLTNFTDISYSPSFRCDGGLVAVGGESGLVQIFDPNKARPVLRRLRAHSRGGVRVVRYPQVADKVHLFTAGDDAVMNYWDAAAETRLLSFPAAHKDYIRAGSASPVQSEVFATGSYDHMVKLWDVRISPDGSSNPIISGGFDHGSPVESILFLPSGSLLATAGGNCVKIWDVIGGGRLLHTLESHNKTVTSICIGKMGKDDGGESRLLSVSIDGYLKVFDYTAFKITHSMRYPSMLLSVASSPTGLVRVIGTNNGVVYVGKKKEKKKEEAAQIGSGGIDGFVVEEGREKAVLRPTNYRYFKRGQNEKPSQGDYVVKRMTKVKLAEYDKLLKKFRHKEALLSALNQKNPNSIVAVMEELVARKKLFKCVTNLDVDELGLLLGFLQRFATMPRYARFLIGLTQKVLQMRADDALSSDKLRCHVRNLKRMVAEEIQIQRSLQEIQGIISPLLRIVAGR